MSDEPGLSAKRKSSGRLTAKAIAAASAVGLVIVVLATAIVAIWSHATWALLFDTARSVTIILAAVSAFPIGYITYRRQLSTDDERASDREKLELARDNEASRRQELLEATERSQRAELSARFSAAAEMLSSEKTASRLAGAFSLVEVTDTWVDMGSDQAQVGVNTLCAVIRMPMRTTGEWLPDGMDLDEWDRLSASEQEKQQKPPVFEVEDLLLQEAILAQIAARLKPGVKNSWSHLRFDFAGATIQNAPFNGAVFGQPVNFTRVTFKEHANFDGAQFVAARFDQSRFEGATNFSSAKFTSIASFSSCLFELDLWMVDVDAPQTEIYLNGSLFRGLVAMTGSVFLRVVAPHAGFRAQLKCDQMSATELNLHSSVHMGSLIQLGGAVIERIVLTKAHINLAVPSPMVTKTKLVTLPDGEKLVSSDGEYEDMPLGDMLPAWVGKHPLTAEQKSKAKKRMAELPSTRGWSSYWSG